MEVESPRCAGEDAGRRRFLRRCSTSARDRSRRSRRDRKCRSELAWRRQPEPASSRSRSRSRRSPRSPPAFRFPCSGDAVCGRRCPPFSPAPEAESPEESAHGRRRPRAARRRTRLLSCLAFPFRFRLRFRFLLHAFGKFLRARLTIPLFESLRGDLPLHQKFSKFAALRLTLERRRAHFDRSRAAVFSPTSISRPRICPQVTQSGEDGKIRCQRRRELNVTVDFFQRLTICGQSNVIGDAPLTVESNSTLSMP